MKRTMRSLYLSLTFVLFASRALCDSPIPPGSVEAANIKQATDLMTRMGYAVSAAEIQQDLSKGEISQKKKGHPTCSSTGQVEIPIDKLNHTGSPKLRTKPFRPVKDFAFIFGLALTLYHENIHANHQSLGDYWWGNMPGKSGHEIEAWSKTLETGNKWLQRLKKAAAAAKGTPGEADALTKVKLAANYLAGLPNVWATESKYHGAGDKVKKRAAQLEKAWNADQKAAQTALDAMRDTMSQTPGQASATTPQVTEGTQIGLGSPLLLTNELQVAIGDEPLIGVAGGQLVGAEGTQIGLGSPLLLTNELQVAIGDEPLISVAGWPLVGAGGGLIVCVDSPRWCNFWGSTLGLGQDGPLASRGPGMAPNSIVSNRRTRFGDYTAQIDRINDDYASRAKAYRQQLEQLQQLRSTSPDSYKKASENYVRQMEQYRQWGQEINRNSYKRLLDDYNTRSQRSMSTASLYNPDGTLREQRSFSINDHVPSRHTPETTTPPKTCVPELDRIRSVIDARGGWSFGDEPTKTIEDTRYSYDAVGRLRSFRSQSLNTGVPEGGGTISIIRSAEFNNRGQPMRTIERSFRINNPETNAPSQGIRMLDGLPSGNDLLFPNGDTFQVQRELPEGVSGERFTTMDVRDRRFGPDGKVIEESSTSYRVLDDNLGQATRTELRSIRSAINDAPLKDSGGEPSLANYASLMSQLRERLGSDETKSSDAATAVASGAVIKARRAVLLPNGRVTSDSVPNVAMKVTRPTPRVPTRDSDRIDRGSDADPIMAKSDANGIVSLSIAAMQIARDVVGGAEKNEQLRTPTGANRGGMPDIVHVVSDMTPIRSHILRAQIDQSSPKPRDPATYLPEGLVSRVVRTFAGGDGLYMTVNTPDPAAPPSSGTPLGDAMLALNTARGVVNGLLSGDQARPLGKDEVSAFGELGEKLRQLLDSGGLKNLIGRDDAAPARNSVENLRSLAEQLRQNPLMNNKTRQEMRSALGGLESLVNGVGAKTGELGGLGDLLGGIGGTGDLLGGIGGTGGVGGLGDLFGGLGGVLGGGNLDGLGDLSGMLGGDRPVDPLGGRLPLGLPNGAGLGDMLGGLGGPGDLLGGSGGLLDIMGGRRLGDMLDRVGGPGGGLGDLLGGINSTFPVSPSQDQIGGQLPGAETVTQGTTPSNPRITDGDHIIARHAASTLVKAIHYLEGLPTDQIRVEPNLCREKQLNPSDPYFSSSKSWGQKGADQWAIQAAGIVKGKKGAWEIEDGSSAPVVVAVIDSGIDWNHADIAWKNLWQNEDEIPNNGKDDDNNGYVDDTLGWNFIDNNNAPWDNDGHGTFVAGVIAADVDNKLGIAGISRGARIMTLKALNDFGHTRAAFLSEAIFYAADNGAKVINISAGGAGITKTEQEAITYAHEKGAIVIVAAGNEGVDTSNYAPAGLDHVLTVAATDRDSKRTRFSNWGQGIDIAAPGMDVLSLRARGTDLMLGIEGVDYKAGSAYVGKDKRYYRASGTSFAAPIVSGVASLILSKDPKLTNEQVERMILQSAKDIETPGWDQYAGAGLIDAVAALEADPAHFLTVSIRAVQVVQHGDSVALEVVGTLQGSHLTEASVELGYGDAPRKWQKISRINKPVHDARLALLPASHFNKAGKWSVRVVTTDKKKLSRESRASVNIE